MSEVDPLSRHNSVVSKVASVSVNKTQNHHSVFEKTFSTVGDFNKIGVPFLSNDFELCFLSCGNSVQDQSL
jgi:hypothetical protein